MDHNPPLLQLQRALPWPALFAVMSQRWAAAGTNVAGRPGLPWEVAWSGPWVVWLLVQQLHARAMAASLAAHVVARVCMGRQAAPQPQSRAHATIARASTALGQEGVEESNVLMLHVAQDCGFADGRMLAADTPAPELPLGSPNAPGIWRGVAPRWGRAVAQLTTRGVVGVNAALAQVQTLLRSVNAPHRCAQGTPAKRQVVTCRLPEVGPWVVQTRSMVQRRGASRERMPHGASTPLQTRPEVARRLVPQSVPGSTTGVVAKGTSGPAGVPQARAIVRHKAGKPVACGRPYLLRRLGGGSIVGPMRQERGDDTQRLWEAWRGSQDIVGPEAPPAWMVYDRGGGVKRPMEHLAKAGVKQVGVQPKGKAAWRGAEAVREVVRSERGQTAGLMGTLKSNASKCNKPQARLWQTLERAGPRSLWSCNLNKWMREVVRPGKEGKQVSAQKEEEKGSG